MPRTARVGQITTADIRDAGVKVVQNILLQIQSDLIQDPERALEEVLLGKRHKKALRIDVNAEDSFCRQLRTYRSHKFSGVTIHGEEDLRDPELDLTQQTGLVVLVDAVDGTDLVERGLHNWCTAAIFYKPTNEKGRRILGAFVGIPPRMVYYAIAGDDKVYVQNSRSGSPVTAKGGSSVKRLRDASVCFYGQKAANLLSVSKAKLLSHVVSLNDRRKTKNPGVAGFRIYTLSGIPMMMKLIDHRVKSARGIDAVFDIEGQKPHDVVPGAYIAKKAGATLIDLKGKEISYDQLEDALLRPASDESELRYVLATTKELAKEVRSMLAP